MKYELVVDAETEQILRGLAAKYPGGSKAVLNHAIRAFASIEDRLEEIVSTPGFREMMRRSAKNIREGKVIPHREAMALVRARRKKNGRT